MPHTLNTLRSPGVNQQWRNSVITEYTRQFEARSTVLFVRLHSEVNNNKMINGWFDDQEIVGRARRNSQRINWMAHARKNKNTSYLYEVRTAREINLISSGSLTRAEVVQPITVPMVSPERIGGCHGRASDNDLPRRSQTLILGAISDSRRDRCHHRSSVDSVSRRNDLSRHNRPSRIFIRYMRVMSIARTKGPPAVTNGN